MSQPVRSRRTVSPLVTAIIAAVAVLLGAWIGAFTQGRSNLALEEKKFESALILKAVETGDPDKATQNLVFFIDAGFIKDPGGKIKALANKRETVLVLPPPVQTTVQVPLPAAAIRVPNVVGLPLEEAIKFVTAAGLLSNTAKEQSSQVAGTVIAQAPPAGSVVPPNTTILLRIAER